MGFLNQILFFVSGLGNTIFRSCESGVREGWRWGWAGWDGWRFFGERVAGDDVDDYCLFADVEEFIAVSRVVVSRVRGKY